MSRILTCLFLLASLVVAQVAPEPMTLVSGQSVEREIAGDESHTYQLTLTAGQFVRFQLEQRAIDAGLILTAPDGKQLVKMNLTQAGDEESLSLEAATTGSYRLMVRGSGQATKHASYRLVTAVQAAATAEDRQRLAAEALLVEANESSGKSAQQMIEKLQRALPLWRELREPFWAAWSLERIGNAYDKLRQYEKAIEYFEQSLVIAREIGNRRTEAAALNDLGSAYYGLSGFEKALVYHEQARALYRELQDRQGEGLALTSLGSGHARLGRNEKAIEYYEQNLALAREAQDRSEEGNALNMLSGMYGSLKLYEKQIEYYEQALALYRELKDRQREGITLNNLGAAYNGLSGFEKAIDCYKQTLAIMRELKSQVGEGSALHNLGSNYLRLAQSERAIDYFEQALTLYRKLKVPSMEATLLNKLGLAYTNLGRKEQASGYFEQALDIYQESVKPGAGSYLYERGLMQQRLGRTDEAAASYTQAVAFRRATGNKSGESFVLAAFARLERDRGHLLEALTHIEESLRLAESLRADLASPESRAALLASIQDSYHLYIDLLMRLHQREPQQGMDARAVEVSERRRARSLLDLLTEAHTDVRQGVDAALLERERILGRQLNDRAQRLTQAATPAQTAALKREISQLETDYERAQAAIRKASPHYAALTQPQPLKLTEIQQQLDADTLLLEYALGPERSYLWAITKDSLTSYELPKEAEIKQSALQVYELLTARSANKRNETPPDRRARLAQAEAKLPAAAQTLSQQVLGPVAAQLGNKRLVIVADGALQYIPFAMLPEPVVGGQLSVVGKNQPPATSHQPLIVQHEIISLPSASALAIQRTELAGRPPAPKMLAVIADPVFDRTDERLKAAATATSEQAQAVSFNDARSIAHLAGKDDDKASGTAHKIVIPRLPYTRQEATQLLALTPKNTSFSAMDFQANRMTVLDPALSQYRYVHFATHGLADTERPGLSSLVLSTVDAQGKAQDGFLRANDIYNLKLPAELVVLSACQTGLGKDVKGEGLVGLTRGFMYAGAARVVVSLWSVNDRATANLMTKFYQKMLKQGERPAAALRAAQVEMWKQKQWQSPYYWAAFVMQGEWH